MNTPDVQLMRRYGTEDVFLRKLAGEEALLARLAGGLMGAGYARHEQNDAAKQQAQAAAMNEMGRELELLRIDRAALLLRGTPVPRFANPSMPFRDVPGGRIDNSQWQHDYDDGTVRLASIAAGAGSDMAKQAGFNMAGFAKTISEGASKAVGAIKGVPGMLKGGLGWKGNLALGAAGVGTLALGHKAVSGARNVAGAELAGPTTYGGGRFGTQIPMGVNEYGQPQLGTPL